MPALPSPGKVIRTDLFFTYGPNTRVRDRIFFQYAGAGPNATDLTTLAGTISAAWNTNMVPQTNASLTLTQIMLTDLASNVGQQVPVTVSRVGTLLGNALPDGTAMVIKFKVARRYRGGHPRFYLAGRVQGDLATLNSWVTGTATTVAAAFQSFITACEATPPTNIGTMTHVNVSYFAGFTATQFPTGRFRNIPKQRTSPVVDAVTAYSVNGLVASQRRRNSQSA